MKKIYVFFESLPFLNYLQNNEVDKAINELKNYPIYLYILKNHKYDFGSFYDKNDFHKLVFTCSDGTVFYDLDEAIEYEKDFSYNKIVIKNILKNNNFIIRKEN